MEIVTIETRSLGDRSYRVVDGDAGGVVDPQRDIDRADAAPVRRTSCQRVTTSPSTLWASATATISRSA